MSSRFDLGDSGPSPRPPRDNARRPPYKDSGDQSKPDRRFDAFSRDTFGSAKDGDSTSFGRSDSNRPSKPKKDAEGFEFAGRAQPQEVKKEPKKEQSHVKAVVGGKFQGFASDDEDGTTAAVASKPVSTKPEKEVVKILEPLQPTPTASRTNSAAPAGDNARFGGFFDSATSTPRDSRPLRTDRPREPRDQRDQRGGDDLPQLGGRFGDFGSERSERPSRFGDRPPREEREPRTPREDRPMRREQSDRFNNYPTPTPLPPPVEAPKEVVAGTNKDVDHLPTFTTVAATGKTGEMSQMSTKVAGWGAAAAPATPLAFGATEQKQQPSTAAKVAVEKTDKAPAKPAVQKPKAETPLQKAVSGTATVVPLGQAKKSIGDIVPFPTVENGKTNFGTAIATSVADQDYSLNDIVTLLNKQFIDQYGRYFVKESKGTADEGKVVGFDILHEIFIIALKKLIEVDMSKVVEYFKDYDTAKLLNFCPHAIVSLTDTAAQRTKAVEFFKANDIAKCLSALDAGDSANTVSKDTIDVQLMDAVQKLTTVDVAAITAIIKPLEAEIKAEITANSTAFIQAIFTPCVEKQLPKPTIIALLDALNALNLLNYDLIEKWQNESSGTIKRDIMFKTATWMSDHKPQLIVDQYEEDEEFDDGF